MKVGGGKSEVWETDVEDMKVGEREVGETEVEDMKVEGGK